MVGPVENQGQGGNPPSSPLISSSKLNVFGTDEISSLDYLSQVSKATSENKNAQYSSAITNAQVLINLYQAFAENSIFLQQLFKNIQDAVVEWRNLVASETTMQNAATEYNSAVDGATLNMNNAINTYNQTVPPTAASKQALQSAQSQYQQSIQDAVSTYNQAVATYNSQTDSIRALNGELAKLGQPPLISGQFPEVSSLNGNVPGVTQSFVQNPPIGPLNNPHAPAITMHSAPPDTIEILNTVFQPAALAFVRSMNNATARTELFQAFQILQQGLQGTQSVGLPPAYIQRHYEAFMSAFGTPSIGTGPTLIASGSLVDDPSLAGILSNAAYEDVFQKIMDKTPLPASLIAQLQLLTLNILSNEAINAGNQVAEGGSAGTIGAPAQLAGAAAFGANLIAAIGDGNTKAAVQALIARNDVALQLSDEDRSRLLAALTAVLNITLLRLAASQLAVVLRAPGLFTHLLDTVVRGGALPPDLVAQIVNATAQPSLTRTLARTTTKLELILKLGAQLTGATVGKGVALSPDAAQALAAGVVNTVSAQKEIANTDQLTSAFSNALTQSGVIGPLNGLVASSAAGFVNTESALPFLDQPFGLTPAQTSALLNQLQRAAPQQSNAITAAVNTTLGNNTTNPFVNIRDFRSNLTQNLTANGVPEAQANTLANQAAQAVRPGTQAEINHLIAAQSNPGGAPSLTQAQLIESLNNVITGQLSGSPNRTIQAVAQQVDDTTLRIVQAFSQNLAVLKENIREDDLRRYILDSQIFGNPTLGQVVIGERVNEIVRTQADAVLAGMTPAGQADMRTNKIVANPNFIQSIDIQI